MFLAPGSVGRIGDPHAPNQGVGWTPAQMFAGGRVGVWYDPSDLSTLFKDTAGTIPVTADGDSVALVLDKSGNGKHLVQSTGTSQAKYKTSGGLSWLLFDGTDDSYGTNAAIDFSASDEIFLAAGAYKASDAVQSVLAELSASRSANNGSFSFFVPNTAAGLKYQFIPHGTLDPGTVAGSSSVAFAAPNTAVLTLDCDISTDLGELGINGVSAALSSGDLGTGNFGNYTLYVGRRNNTSFPLNGRLHGLIVRGGARPDATERARINAYMAAKSGVTL